MAVVPPLAEDLKEYAKLRSQQQLLESQIDLIKVRRDALEAGFGDVLDDRQANVLRADDVTVSRSIVNGRTTTDIKAAIADGVITEDVIKPYQKTSDPHSRWTVRKPKPKTKKSKGDA
ncbi:hypothetical protein [Sulfobacillus harzensis]|uniref:Uncharacterized protein n=1 Tax=Sulfobacillus harzensis TaxID=2729629 RepID=A0A7Y0Q681_9FIRM|nr:hypothetical protein [Sulfobacillus harzensis]NMP25054.1 hypothetical protein [Sulfobacillus harzensis]